MVISSPGNSLDPERLDGAGRVAPGRTQVRSDFSSRHMVGATRPHIPRPLGLRRLLDVGRVPGRALRVRTVSLTLLLPTALRRRTARVVRSQAAVVAGSATL